MKVMHMVESLCFETEIHEDGGATCGIRIDLDPSEYREWVEALCNNGYVALEYGDYNITLSRK